MMVPVCSDYDPSRFPKSVWKHAVCEDSSYLVGSDEAQAAAPCVGQVKPWAELLTPGTPELIGWALLAATQVSRSTEHLAFLSVQAASLFILKGRQPVRANLTARLVARIWKGRVFIFLCFLEILWRNAELSQCLERGNIMWWLSSCEAEASIWNLNLLLISYVMLGKCQNLCAPWIFPPKLWNGSNFKRNTFIS